MDHTETATLLLERIKEAGYQESPATPRSSRKFVKTYSGIITETVEISHLLPDIDDEMRLLRSLPGSLVLEHTWTDVNVLRRNVVYDDAAFENALKKLTSIRWRRTPGASQFVNKPSWPFLRALYAGREAGTLASSRDCSCLEALKQWEKEYGSFLKFVCPELSSSASTVGDRDPIYNLLGCDTPKRIERFCKFIKIFHIHHSLLIERRGKKCLYSRQFAALIRKERQFLMRSAQAICTAAKKLGDKCTVGKLAKMTRLTDRKFINEILSNPEVKNSVKVWATLHRRHDIPLEQLKKLSYKK